ncbi:MAG: hypothetical protein KDB53_01930, partial [Planctomycetes bacterium]|nr:hypothetical protein [Planctomycetota bacterium]
KYRSVIALRFFGSHSTETIATMLGISPGAVRVRVHRALARLRRHPGLAAGRSRDFGWAALLSAFGFRRARAVLPLAAVALVALFAWIPSRSSAPSARDELQAMASGPAPRRAATPLRHAQSRDEDDASAVTVPVVEPDDEVSTTEHWIEGRVELFGTAVSADTSLLLQVEPMVNGADWDLDSRRWLGRFPGSMLQAIGSVHCARGARFRIPVPNEGVYALRISTPSVRGFAERQVNTHDEPSIQLMVLPDLAIGTDSIVAPELRLEIREADESIAMMHRGGGGTWFLDGPIFSPAEVCVRPSPDQPAWWFRATHARHDIHLPETALTGQVSRDPIVAVCTEYYASDGFEWWSVSEPRDDGTFRYLLPVHRNENDKSVVVVRMRNAWGGIDATRTLILADSPVGDPLVGRPAPLAAEIRLRAPGDRSRLEGLVVLVCSRQGIILRGTSDRSGRVLCSVPETPADVSAQNPDETPVTVFVVGPEQALVKVIDTDLLRLRRAPLELLIPPSRPWNLTIVESPSGEPIAGARARIIPVLGNQPAWFMARNRFVTADERGRLHLPPTSDGLWLLDLDTVPCGQVQVVVERPFADGMRVEIPRRVDSAAGTLQLRVIDEADRPLPLASGQIQARGSPQIIAAATDEHGVLREERLSRHADYRVWIHAPGRAPSLKSLDRVPADGAVRDFRMVALQRVSVQVSSAETHALLPSAFVIAQAPDEGDGSPHAMTWSREHAGLDLTREPQTITFFAPGRREACVELETAIGGHLAAQDIRMISGPKLRVMLPDAALRHGRLLLVPLGMGVDADLIAWQRERGFALEPFVVDLRVHAAVMDLGPIAPGRYLVRLESAGEVLCSVEYSLTDDATLDLVDLEDSPHHDPASNDSPIVRGAPRSAPR